MEITAGLDLMSQTLECLESDGFVDDVAHEMAERIDGLIDSGFTTATDPYGHAWTPRKKPYPWPPLRKSGEMADSFIVSANAAGVKVVNPTLYSPFQHYGTKYIDARPMLPSEDLGLWDKPLRDAADIAFRRCVK